MSRLSRIMQTRLERGIAPFGLTRLMWCVLTGVGDEGITNPSELADYIGITRPATSRLLKDMAAKGLVCRNGGSGDGRTIALSLSDSGQDVLTRARVAVDEMHRHFMTKLSPEMTAQFMHALDALSADEHERLTKL
ncbi:MarR family transcriptional regulator [Mesorhizobium sp. Z1-4]|uniref:MarR family winged helix-turn-helix transcriptional regulator n=1 Tax=Mesorhizobium sp. Z1-4 TaxID=2448478 RepID=UPI001981E905|nr:MarR family transcriptional regulator [Mesorhizobium sp. Z1-4]